MTSCKGILVVEEDWNLRRCARMIVELERMAVEVSCKTEVGRGILTAISEAVI